MSRKKSVILNTRSCPIESLMHYLIKRQIKMHQRISTDHVLAQSKVQHTSNQTHNT